MIARQLLYAVAIVLFVGACCRELRALDCCEKRQMAGIEPAHPCTSTESVSAISREVASSDIEKPRVSVPAASAVDSVAEGHAVATGKLEAAQHEQIDGFFNVGTFSISVPKDSIAATVLREHLGSDVRLVLIRNEPRKPERIDR